MAQVNGNDKDTAKEPRYETPTFDPRGAFAWTQRSGEIARRRHLQRENRLPDPSELASNEPDMAQQVNGNEKNSSRARRHETPTFDPRGAFAWTLRSGEIARLKSPAAAARSEADGRPRRHLLKNSLRGPNAPLLLQTAKPRRACERARWRLVTP